MLLPDYGRERRSCIAMAGGGIRPRGDERRKLGLRGGSGRVMGGRGIREGKDGKVVVYRTKEDEKGR